MDPEARRKFQNELEGFKRDVDLVAYAQSLGYEVRKRESTRSSKVLSCAATNDKIIVAVDARDEHWKYFSVRDERDNGSIIDFIQRRSPGSHLGAVRAELRRWANTIPPHIKSSDENRVWPSHPDRLAAAAAFARARQVDSCTYLHKRGLRPDTLRSSRFAGTWRVAEPYGNVLFVHLDQDGISGFEAKNNGFTGFSKGGVKSMWQSNAAAGDRTMVICESAINALSYDQLHPNNSARYVSLGGTLSPAQSELLLRSCRGMADGSVIIGAFDADLAGDKFYRDLQQSLASGGATHVSLQRHSPSHEKVNDWNDVLRVRERAYIAAIEPAIAQQRGGLSR